jgi:P27 family predicted phage terminase small subunit
MGRRGPRPVPTAIKRERGVRGDRINSCEPVPSGKTPSCPSWLSPGARRVWRRLGPDLFRRGVLTAWDVDLFALFCDLVDQTSRARDLLGPALLVKRGVKGGEEILVTNPAWRIYRDMLSEIRALAREFGLTPSARSTLMMMPETVGRPARKPTRAGRGP